MTSNRSGPPTDPALWNRADELFSTALDLPPAAWRAWLEAEEPDPAIRDRVLRLLWLDAQSETGRS